MVGFMDSLAKMATSPQVSSVSQAAVDFPRPGESVSPIAPVAAPKSVTLAQSDVKRLPRLSGSIEVGDAGDVDVLSVLQQYRVVAGFRAQNRTSW